MIGVPWNCPAMPASTIENVMLYWFFHLNNTAPTLAPHLGVQRSQLDEVHLVAAGLTPPPPPPLAQKSKTKWPWFKSSLIPFMSFWLPAVFIIILKVTCHSRVNKYCFWNDIGNQICRTRFDVLVASWPASTAHLSPGLLLVASAHRFPSQIVPLFHSFICLHLVWHYMMHLLIWIKCTPPPQIFFWNLFIAAHAVHES